MSKLTFADVCAISRRFALDAEMNFRKTQINNLDPAVGIKAMEAYHNEYVRVFDELCGIHSLSLREAFVKDKQKKSPTTTKEGGKDG